MGKWDKSEVKEPLNGAWAAPIGTIDAHSADCTWKPPTCCPRCDSPSFQDDCHLPACTLALV